MPRIRMRSALLAIAVSATLGLAALAGTVAVFNLRDEAPVDAGDSGDRVVPASPQVVSRGEYLARAGNCMACHTVPGGAPWAGGRGIETPFGVVYSSNLTPDPSTGLGRWTAAHFWRAMHNGRSKDGRLLYPAFPYPHYTLVTRADSDAMFAFLRTQPAVIQPNAAHALRFPYDTQVALAIWRALWFRPGSWRDDPSADAAWNRGAYLVRGLGHCSACHSPRNAWGASDLAHEWAGGTVPMQRWYAPSLVSASEGGVAHWSVAEVVALLRDGVTDRASVLGPMAEVVHRSTQYLSDADLQAIAVFLRSLPEAHGPQHRARAEAVRAAEPDPRRAAIGAAIYSRHCAGCHGDAGEGVAGAFPALAGNRAVTLANPANVIRVVLVGGFLPSTPGNPRPHGMPPFGHLLTDEQVAAVVTHVRTSWGNSAGEVGFSDVVRHR
jgi:mono/diheme cytochrome c family protein